MDIKALRQRKVELLDEAEALMAKEDDRSISEEETARLNAITDDDGELVKVNAQIVRTEKLMDERRSLDLAGVAGEEIEEILPATVKKEDPKFESFGSFLQVVAHNARNPNGPSDGRLHYAAPLGGSESVPADGGFLVQMDHSTMLMDLMHDMGMVKGRTRNIPISANSNGIKLPSIDETSRVNGSRWGGVQSYWSDEADTATATKPTFRTIEMTLKKLLGIAYVTEELLADSVALEAVYSRAFAEEMVFKTEDAIINGTGSGQPLGLLNSGAVISIAKESGQAGSTVVTENILNMMARMPARLILNAVWLINQDILPQLWKLTLGSGTAVTLIFAPPGQGTSAQNAPFGTLMGRPVLPVEYCATLGTAGDIILTDLGEYLTIDKGGVKQDSSMHVQFLTDQMTFRIVFRVDGQPAWNTAVTPFNGTNTQSPFISLAART